MELNVQDWKEFRLSSIMNVFNGKGLTDDEIIENKGLLPAIQGGESNMGILGYIDKHYCKSQNYIVIEEPCLTVARVGTAGYVSYHEKCVIGDKAKALVFKDKKVSTPFKYMFMCTILNTNRYKYSYGRGLVTEIYMNESLKLPIKYNNDNTPVIDENRTYSDEGYIPDWQFMEDYIKSLHHKPITTEVNNGNIPELNIQSWEWFSMGKLFDIKKGKRLTSADQEEGNNNYVGAIDSNNGIANHIGQAPIHEANTISLSYNGSVGEAFYQSEPYWATDDVNALYSRYSGFNKQIGLFMATVIRQEKYKFSYGRKWTLENMNSTDIKLPIQMDSNGKPVIDDNRTYSDNGYIPDWQFMEDYINSLPYSDRI